VESLHAENQDLQDYIEELERENEELQYIIRYEKSTGPTKVVKDEVGQ